MKDSAIVIRCMYNNQGWNAPCIKPGTDSKCERCFNPKVQIRPPQWDDETCSGNCWERYVCKDYKWGCYPKGNSFTRAYVGMRVFFVYRNSDGFYTIWGTSKVASIDKLPMQTGRDFEDGYKFIRFEPFEQLPRDKWVSSIKDKQMVGQSWRQGRLRYIDSERELHLEKLIEGEKPEPIETSTDTVPPSANTTLSIDIMPHINEKLDKIAQQEGRHKEDIIREAIAEWIRNR